MTDYQHFGGAVGGKAGKFKPGLHSSAAAFPEMWKLEGKREAAMHTQSVHAPEVKAERERRERGKRYDAMKAELHAARAARAASDATDSIAP